MIHTTGLTRSLKLEERVCSLCLSGEIEEKYHFLLKCNVFADIRVNYISNIMRNNADFMNLIFDHQMLERNTKFYMQRLCLLSSSAHCIRFVYCKVTF